ncbi:hypothetical protein [Labedella populi]|uniref:hypothetical protein n=1 Tax=Labedella populi TaxID=2498850 RepID=UPI00140B7BE5|nr:hypothetical protein [Labedella populi]
MALEDRPLDKSADDAERGLELDVVDHERAAVVLGEPVLVPQSAEGTGDRFVDEPMGTIELGDARHEDEPHSEVTPAPRDVLTLADEAARPTGDDGLTRRAHRLEVETDVAREVEGLGARQGQHRLEADPNRHDAPVVETGKRASTLSRGT